ncbi:MAG: hypothetical protein GC171_03580 [Terrimonas sp.]|nr:hypothetical protein [Terrimonas sp.]
MRISWGYKIAAVYILFVAGILFLAYKASHQHFDLVTENYYAAELKYQDVIDHQNNVSALSAPLEIRNSSNQVVISFPKDFAGQPITGEAYLYCPSDEKKDLRKKFEIHDLRYQLLLPGRFSGQYQLKLSWNSGGKEYYQEEKIMF